MSDDQRQNAASGNYRPTEATVRAKLSCPGSLFASDEVAALIEALDVARDDRDQAVAAMREGVAVMVKHDSDAATVCNHPCVKCSPGLDVAVSYHPRRSYCDPYSSYTFNSREDEHLHYVCRNCGYDWTGDVADA